MLRSKVDDAIAERSQIMSMSTVMVDTHILDKVK